MKVSKGFLTTQNETNERPVPFFPYIREKDIVNMEKVNGEYTHINTSSYRKTLTGLFIQKGNILDLYYTINLNTFKVIPTSLCLGATKGTLFAGFDSNNSFDFRKDNTTSFFDLVNVYSDLGYFKHETSGSNIIRTNTTDAFFYKNPVCTDVSKQICTPYSCFWRPFIESDGMTDQYQMNKSMNDIETGWWSYESTEPIASSGIGNSIKWVYLGKSTSIMHKIELPANVQRIITKEAGLYYIGINHLDNAYGAEIKLYSNGTLSAGSASTNISNIYVVMDPITKDFNYGYGLAPANNSGERVNTLGLNDNYHAKVHIKCMTM